MTTARPSPEAARESWVLGDETIQLADGSLAWVSTDKPGETPNRLVIVKDDLIITVASDLPIETIQELASQIVVKSWQPAACGMPAMALIPGTHSGRVDLPLERTEYSSYRGCKMRKLVSVFVLLVLLSSAWPGVVLAQESPPEVQLDGGKEPQPAPPPPPDVRVYTVTVSPKGGLSGPGGGYAVQTAIMNYFKQGWSWYARAGSKIDLVSGTSHAWAYATLKKYGWSSPTSNCFASGTGECTTYTDYYYVSGQVTAQADATVYWSAGGSTSATEYVYHNF